MIAVPAVMLGFGVMTFVFGGLAALWALIPILAIHVLVAIVVLPIWRYYQRRHMRTSEADG